MSSKESVCSFSPPIRFDLTHQQENGQLSGNYFSLIVFCLLINLLYVEIIISKFTRIFGFLCYPGILIPKVEKITQIHLSLSHECFPGDLTDQWMPFYNICWTVEALNHWFVFPSSKFCVNQVILIDGWWWNCPCGSNFRLTEPTIINHSIGHMIVGYLLEWWKVEWV